MYYGEMDRRTRFVLHLASMQQRQIVVNMVILPEEGWAQRHRFLKEQIRGATENLELIRKAFSPNILAVVKQFPEDIAGLERLRVLAALLVS
jgi:arsenite-transporting ATPase